MSTKSHNKSFQAPKGTRDFYPEELLRRRYIAETWRAVSIRHGFEEIDGPTFEHADLYTVKSGEGILSELFSFRREGGDDLYALRPEFTPTLARMYAARARQLPNPTRWFCIPNFFRAENPQRGRLREFYQWNVDVLGGEGGKPFAQEDKWSPDLPSIDVMTVIIDSMRATGLSSRDLRLRVSDRTVIAELIQRLADGQDLDKIYRVLDKGQKPNDDSALAGVAETVISSARYIARSLNQSKPGDPLMYISPTPNGESIDCTTLCAMLAPLHHMKQHDWIEFDLSIVRGLAYYTGTVFEVIAEGERAIAGGGRYDNLVELFGGPPTPACGFGMGDVVLSLVLEDRGLMPRGMGELMDAVECVMRSYSMRPDAFVFSNGDEAAEARVVPLMAELRRGVEKGDWLGGGGKPWRPERYAVRPMHVRTTGKSTRNVGKLLKDAASSNARFAVILESGEHATVKDLTTGEEHKDTPIEKIARKIAG